MRTLISQMSSSQIASNLQGNSSKSSFGSGFGAAISSVVVEDLPRTGRLKTAISPEKPLSNAPIETADH